MYRRNDLREEQEKIISDKQPPDSRPSSPSQPSDGVLKQSAGFTKTVPHSLQEHLHDTIPKILSDPHLCASICKLSGDEAQRVIDFFDIVLSDVGILRFVEWKRALHLSCKLAQSAQVYPKYYKVKGAHQYGQKPASGGGFADIYRGVFQGQAICLKAARVETEAPKIAKLSQMHAREITLLAHLSHPNILPFCGVYVAEVNAKTFLISPWMENGNLRGYVNRFPEHSRIPWISDIVNGLLYLHQLDILHGDLKGENVLVSNDGRALITDFGLSCFEIDAKVSIHGFGPIRWMAPELLEEDPAKRTKACDIWSLACLCYEILSRKDPFYQYKRDHQVIAALQRQNLPKRPEVQDGADKICDEMWSLMIDCWTFNPQHRLGVEIIRNQIAARTGIKRDLLQMPEVVGGKLAFWKHQDGRPNNEIDLQQGYQVLRHIQEAALPMGTV